MTDENRSDLVDNQWSDEPAEPLAREPYPPPSPERATSRLRSLLAIAGWMFLALVFGGFLLLDPLDVHPVDGWLQHALGLQRAGDSGAGAEVSSGGAMDRGEPLFFRNPMNPTITSPVPMQDNMGMDYVPVYADVLDDPSGELGGVKGQGATISIDPAVVQNMNVRTVLVQRGDVQRAIRTVGYLDYDQQRMVTVTTKYPGFVEKVYVNYVGEPVRAGQPLFEIYSPELVQTQEELLNALAFARRLEGAPEEARRRVEALADAARQRLAYWDVSAQQIARLAESGHSFRTVTVTAPKTGLVMKRMPGLEGMAVRPGMELFHIADLSSLWLSVEVFEDQLPWLRPGSVAEMTLPYFPGEVFRGRVRFVEPQVNEKTRTVGLRLEVSNRDGRLRAGMYATVRFTPAVAREVLIVPSQAVIRTGERNLVVVALGEGRFATREVVLGAEGDSDVAVLSGLAAGDRVVTASQFLLDSESSIRTGILQLLKPQTKEPTESETGDAAVDHSTMDAGAMDHEAGDSSTVDHEAMGHERPKAKEASPVTAPDVHEGHLKPEMSVVTDSALHGPGDSPPAAKRGAG